MSSIAQIVEFVSKDENLATRFTLEILTQHIEYIKKTQKENSKEIIEEIKHLKYIVKNSMTVAVEILKNVVQDQIDGRIGENPVDNIENYIYTLLSIGENIPENTPPSLIAQWNQTYQLPEHSPYLYRSYPIDPITRRSIKPRRIDWSDIDDEIDVINTTNQLIEMDY
jgi:hypothetical protein